LELPWNGPKNVFLTPENVFQKQLEYVWQHSSKCAEAEKWMKHVFLHTYSAKNEKFLKIELRRIL